MTAPRRRWWRGRYTLVGLCAAALVLAVVVTVVAIRVLAPDESRIPDGISIQGIPVGGLRADEATQLVRTNARPPSRSLRFVSADQPAFGLTVALASLDPVPDLARAVRRALEQPSPLTRIRAEVGLGVERREIPLTYRLAPARADRVTAMLAVALDRPARSASLRVADGTIALARSRRGREVDRAALRRLLRRLPSRVEVPVRFSAPAVADAAARETRRRSLLVVATPVTVSAEGARAVLRRDLLLRALRFSASGPRIVARIDPEAITPTLTEGLAPALREARSAGFAIRGDRVSITPSRDGRRPDAGRVARLLVSRPARRAIRAPFALLRPERTTADARAMRIRERISQFTTPYDCCPPRVTNIKLAASILDGAIIPAGGTFSLNEVLGERTAERGFVPAPQINAGMLEDAVGGGVSQIATTLYNAAFFAGLDLVSHTPHEFYIGRYPPGREATVSFGGPELIVRNDWPAAVLVSASATDTSITFRLYSSTLGRRVTTESGPAGAPGTPFSISYTRKVFRGDELVRDETYRWSYTGAPG